MRVVSFLLALLAAATAFAQSAPTPPQTLVREVVYNELNDHQRHGYWRYWVARQAGAQTRLSQQVETADGPIARLVSSGGQPLSPQAASEEEQQLRHLAASPAEQARRRQAYADDERRIGRILALLPEAFLYDDLGERDGLRHLRFRPNPAYPTHSIEARVFHAMCGELIIDARLKRLAHLEGRLESDVEFGYGLLGRVDKGGWFLLERAPAGGADWKTVHLELHMNGRALLLKTIARDTSERRGGFESIPAGLSLTQGIALLGTPPAQTTAQAAAQARPASLPVSSSIQSAALSVRR